MVCIICENLKRAFEARQSEYVKARSAVYYRVCTQLAAYKIVDMERARNELEEHRLVCVSAKKESAMLPVVQSAMLPVVQSAMLPVVQSAMLPVVQSAMLPVVP
jgi:Zn-dependent peptidase ImmA (M78 family)